VLGAGLGTPAWAKTDGNTSSSKIGQPVSAALLHTLDQASQAGLKTDAGQFPNPLKRISGSADLGTDKPVVLYMGAEFCPFCASLRWPLVLALLRFGDFEGLRYMRSSGTDVHPNT